MPIYKRCHICNKRVAAGSKCECVKAIEEQYKKNRNKEYDRTKRNKESDRFYHSSTWKIAQSTAISLDEGIDVYVYLTTGEMIVADTVHHIIPLKDDWNKRLHIDNLISLSGNTHSMLERQYKDSKTKEILIKTLQNMIKKHRKAML